MIYYLESPRMIQAILSLRKIIIISKYSTCEIGRASNLVLTNALKAAGTLSILSFFGIVGMWLICIPVAYILGIHFNLGLVGIWIAFAIDECFRGLIFTFRIRGKKWTNKSFIS